MNENNDEQPTRHVHHRAVMPGRELFEVDASDLAFDDDTPDLTGNGSGHPNDVDADDAPDDEDAEGDPLLAELPPHWGVFNRRD